MQDPGTTDLHIERPGNLPILAWTADALSLDAGFTARTQGSGCVDNAIAFLLCDVDGPCTVGDAIAVAGVGDSGIAFADGVAVPGGAQLRLQIQGNPACGGATVTPERGATLELAHTLVGGAQALLSIALPPVALGASMETLYVGGDGATWQDRELTQLVSRRPR